MGTITATGPDIIGFHAPEDEDFVFGGIMFGSTAGLLAFADGFGPNQQNGYSDAAGVEGRGRPAARRSNRAKAR
jgi:hypothetical protein